jgi:hypothetical protein
LEKQLKALIKEKKALKGKSNHQTINSQQSIEKKPSVPRLARKFKIRARDTSEPSGSKERTSEPKGIRNNATNNLTLSR